MLSSSKNLIFILGVNKYIVSITEFCGQNCNSYAQPVPDNRIVTYFRWTGCNLGSADVPFLPRAEVASIARVFVQYIALLPETIFFPPP